MIKDFIRLSLIFLSCLWAFACSPGPGGGASSTAPESQHISAAHVQAHDFAPGQLEAHYQKHGYQFGNITIEQYLARARELLDAPAGNDIQEKTRPNGDILHYRVSTGEFAVMNVRGRIRTLFKTNMHYWLKQ